MEFIVNIENHMAIRDQFSVNATTKTEAESIGGMMYREKTGFFPEDRQCFANAIKSTKGEL